jgi:hypothetical protein
MLDARQRTALWQGLRRKKLAGRLLRR